MDEHASPALEQRPALEAPRLRSHQKPNDGGVVIFLFLLRAKIESIHTAPGSCGGAATDLVPMLLRNTIAVLLLPVQMRNWLLVAPWLLVQARNFLILLPSAGGAS